jgi:hypothetical protein
LSIGLTLSAQNSPPLPDAININLSQEDDISVISVTTVPVNAPAFA